MARILRFLMGFLSLRVWGFSTERFLNLCARRGIPLWNLVSKEDAIYVCMPLKNFYDLRPLARKTGVRVAIQKRNGLPFFIKKYRGRWAFSLGVIVTILLCIMASQRLWGIEYNGNIKVTEDQLMDFLERQNIKIGKKLSEIQVTELEKALRRTYEDITWTSIRIVGSDLLIDIKERDVPEPSISETDLQGMDLISPYDGIVVSMIVRSGLPKVKIGDVVTKDQVLVEAKVPTYLEDGTVRDILTVTADADIWLEHRRTFEDCFSIYFIEKELTGRERTKYSICFGQKSWPIYSEQTFYSEDIMETYDTPKLLQMFVFPIQIRKTSHRETQKKLRKMEEEGINREAEEKILRFLATLEEKGVQIIEKDVKISIEGDFCLVYGEVLAREKVRLYRKTEEQFDKSEFETTGE